MALNIKYDDSKTFRCVQWKIKTLKKIKMKHGSLQFKAFKFIGSNH